MNVLPGNFILETDSYKFSHYLQMPEEAQFSQSVICARKPNAHTDQIVMAGGQYVSHMLSKVRITVAMVEEAERFTQRAGYVFNKLGWMAIATGAHGLKPGVLPLLVHALHDGTVVTPNTALLTIRNTVKGFAWLPSYLEPMVQPLIWYPTTVASVARWCKALLSVHARGTGSPIEFVDYQLHNFGVRGASSGESAMHSGIAHALIFKGSDAAIADYAIEALYTRNPQDNKDPFLTSVEATEHTTACMHSQAVTRDDFGAARMLVDRLENALLRSQTTQIGMPVVSGVIDTYDSGRFVHYLADPELKERIEAAGRQGARLVLRPDSGDPLEEPFRIAEIAAEVFGVEVNREGYRELPPYIAILQGDGINQDSLLKILDESVRNRWCLSNFVFGMGSGLTHALGRDEFSFAQKTTAMSMDGLYWTPLKKDPITDPGKASLSGYMYTRLKSEYSHRLTTLCNYLEKKPGAKYEFETVSLRSTDFEDVEEVDSMSVMEVLFNGAFPDEVAKFSFQDARFYANQGL